MMNTAIIRAICVLGAVAALVNISQLVSSIPAFHELSRREGLFGDWRVTFNAAMYDRAEYLYELGTEYITADTVASSATEGRDEIASLETALERASEGVALLEESVHLDPADAYTWTSLAWGYGLEGDFPRAREAMANSWAEAPYNSGLSAIRLQFAELLLEVGDEFLETPVSPAEYEATERDFCVASRDRRPELLQILEVSPALAERFGAPDQDCGDLS